MALSSKNMIRGYSLVELSISIIIIGLLVAAVTSGQTLIKQASIRSMIADLRNFQTYYTTFRTTYDAIPGDFNRADVYWGGTTCHATVPTACNGNGDSLIQWSTTATTAAGTGDEAGRALKHLSLSGIMPVNIGQLTITYAGGLNLLTTATQLIPPLLKADQSACLYFAYSNAAVAIAADSIGHNAAGTAFQASPWAGTSTNAVFIGGLQATANRNCSKGAMYPLDAFSIDQKIDDGAYNGATAIGNSTGNFRAIEPMDPFASTCLTGGNYNVTQTSYKSCFVGWSVR